MNRIVVAGHLCVDLMPAVPLGIGVPPGALIEVGRLRTSLGGCVGNTGGNLADLGLHVDLIATIADDELGAVARQLLERRGLPTDRLSIEPGGSTSYSVVVQPPGVDRTFWHHPGSNDRFDGTEVDVDGVALLHVGYPPLLPGLLPNAGEPVRVLMERAKTAGATTSLDLAVVDRDSPVAEVDWALLLEKVLPFVDVFSPSFDDLVSALDLGDDFSSVDLLRTGVEAQAADALASGAAVVAISAGAAGIHIATASAARLAAGGPVLAALGDDWADAGFWQEPAPVDQFTTTSGAGDAASAGLLFALVEGMPIREAVAFSSATAATVIAGQPTTRDRVTQRSAALVSREEHR